MNIVQVFFGACLIVIVGAVGYSYARIGEYHDFVVQTSDEVRDVLSDEPRTAIVFGSAVDPTGQPRSVLQERLDAVAELYAQGAVDRIIVTGYAQPGTGYNEPAAMSRYLAVQYDIPDDNLIRDESGADTYASCKQSADEGLKGKTVVSITQPSHMDRAIFLCRHHGIEAYGYVASAKTSPFNVMYQTVREAFSNVKAVTQTSIN